MFFLGVLRVVILHALCFSRSGPAYLLLGLGLSARLGFSACHSGLMASALFGQQTGF